ncbi:MAG: DUF2520 domain-containing protein, partial [Ignavibacteriae bacterium]
MIGHVTIIGHGRVGGAIAARLHERNVRVDVIDRDHFEQFLHSSAPIGDILVIAVKDASMPDVIERTARERASSLGGVTVLHVNGSLGRDVLAPFQQHGALIAAAHPFQTFRDADPSALDGIGWGCESSAVHRPSSVVHRPMPIVDEFVTVTGGVAVELADTSDEGKRRYHASAVAASNFTFAAYELGRRLAESAQIDPMIFLAPIMKRTMHNAVDALQYHDAFGDTGPLVRGDVEGVKRQLMAIPEDLRPLYRQLSL